MTHDSRCSLAEPCLTAMPTHDCCNNHEDCTACATESGAACFACGNTCQCDLIALICGGAAYWRNVAELELRKLEAEVLPGCLAPDECHCGRCPRVGDSV